jgi:RNA polymerase sigma-70 factor (ECF subfamily)
MTRPLPALPQPAAVPPPRECDPACDPACDPGAAAALAAELPALLRAARALVRSRDGAEDLVQEALLRVWTRMRAGGEIEALRPYLRTTLRNLARRPASLAPAEAAAPEATPPGAADRIACREVLAALAELPPDQAQLLARAALGAATMADLAAETGLPPGTVASRLSRARARLRARFDLPEDGPVAALLER